MRDGVTCGEACTRGETSLARSEYTEGGVSGNSEGTRRVLMRMESERVRPGKRGRRDAEGGTNNGRSISLHPLSPLNADLIQRHRSKPESLSSRSPALHFSSSLVSGSLQYRMSQRRVQAILPYPLLANKTTYGMYGESDDRVDRRQLFCDCMDLA
jgi:hypothetical protein